MEHTEETLIQEEYGRDEEEMLKEAWPGGPEAYAREYEEYLEEIGVRF